MRKSTRNHIIATIRGGHAVWYAGMDGDAPVLLDSLAWAELMTEAEATMRLRLFFSDDPDAYAASIERRRGPCLMGL